MGQEIWLVQIERWKKSVRPQKTVFLCKKLKKLIVHFLKRILVDSALSECMDATILGHVYKRGGCLFMMSNPERCTDMFVVMLKLESGWVGQNQSEHCSNLEIRTEKWQWSRKLFLACRTKCPADLQSSAGHFEPMSDISPI